MKKRMNIKYILGIVTGITLCIAVSVVTAEEVIKYQAKQVAYKSSNVENALNELYIKANQDLLNKVYPVGSIYLSISDKNPSTFIGGEWVQVSQGRTLFGAGKLNDVTYTAGDTIDAGLPNITGSFGILGNGAKNSNMNINYVEGAFYREARSGYKDAYTDGSNSNNTYYAKFDASKSNSIYGNSETVQPNAYVVYMFKRTK